MDFMSVPCKTFPLFFNYPTISASEEIRREVSDCEIQRMTGADFFSVLRQMQRSRRALACPASPRGRNPPRRGAPPPRRLAD